MAPARWFDMLAAEIRMAPGFAAALETQLRDHARTLAGVDIASGDYSLLPPDHGFTVTFRTTGDVVVGVIEGVLVDPSAFGHPVVLSWRATGAAGERIQPDQARSDLEFFWLQFPIAELSAGTRVDTAAIASQVTAPFPVDWDVHHWSSVWLALHAQRAFTADEVAALIAVVQRAVRDWNARESAKISYLAEPEIAPDRTALRCYLDLGASGAAAVVAVLQALGAAPAAATIARVVVGRQR